MYTVMMNCCFLFFEVPVNNIKQLLVQSIDCLSLHVSSLVAQYNVCFSSRWNRRKMSLKQKRDRVKQKKAAYLKTLE